MTDNPRFMTGFKSAPPAIAFLAALFFAAPASAHELTRSTSSWQVEENGRVSVRLILPEIRASFLPALAEKQNSRQNSRQNSQIIDRPAVFRALAAHAAASIGFAYKNQAREYQTCPLAGQPNVRPLTGGHVETRLAFVCPLLPAGTPVRLRMAALSGIWQGHLHFARIIYGDNQWEQVFTAASENAEFVLAPPAPVSPVSGFLAYLPIGGEHILTGWDHLAFLAVLLLLARRLHAALWAITGFTLGHSLTLGLAATGWLYVNVPLVEALIGYTILLAAVEGVARPAHIMPLAGLMLALAAAAVFSFAFLQPDPVISWQTALGASVFTLSYAALMNRPAPAFLLPAMAAVFGLIHGFGFASFLGESLAGGSALLPALAGFNIGVELGQIAAAVLLFAAAGLTLRAAGRYRAAGETFMRSASFCLLAGLGAYWFASRLIA